MCKPQSTDDLLDGIDAYVQQLLELTDAVGDLFRPPVGPSGSPIPQGLDTEPTTWSTTAKVFLEVTIRPLVLATTGFRLVGDGSVVVIAPAAVSFLPSVLKAGEDSFTVTVERGADINGIYQGTVTAASDPGTPITDLVMPAW